MNAKILALVAALALGLSVLLYFMTSGESSGERGESRPQGEALAPSDPTEQEVAEPVLESPPILAEPDTEQLEARRELQDEPEPAPRTWPAEETRWVELQLLFPQGTPTGERASVLALEENGDHEDVYGQGGPIMELAAGEEALSIDGVLGAVDVGADGMARLGLPPEAEGAWLAVSGLYLYSLKLQHIDLGELAGPVVLRPVLGARISGRLRAPLGRDAAEVAGVELELDWSLNAALQLGTAGAEDLDLETETDAEGRFEFRAVPTGKPQTLKTRESVLARSFSEDLEPTPGEHVQLDIALLVGGAVRGRIVDESGKPIAGAEVEAVGREFFGNPTDRLRETESDGDGRFELTGLTPGKVWLKVEHDDYQVLLDTPFELANSEDRQHGDITLGEGLAVSGTVVFPDGSPASGTRISVEPDLSENLAGSPPDPRAYIGARNHDIADETGAYRIKALGSGPWIVSAQLQREHEEGGDMGGLVAGRWTASQSLVRPPAEDVHLTLDAPVTVSGVVLDGQQRPVAAFRVRGERAGSQWYMPPSETQEESFESDDGSFVLGDLRSGEWTFSVEAESYARSNEVELELPTDEQLAFVLLHPILLGGKVVDPDGNPVAGAEVSKELEGTEVFEAMQGRSDWPVAKSDGEGLFRLEGLAPGASSILAKKDGFAPSEALALELDEGEQELDLVLSMRRGGTISGEVYDADGKRASGSMVILQMPTLQERRFTSTDGRGEFQESGLTPGTWQVQAFPGFESLQGENGEALDQAALLAALKMTTVALTDEAEEHVVLGAPPADPVRVHGRVTLDGEPVGESMISFVAAGGGGLDLLKIKALETDGTYELQLNEPGDYLVTIQSSGTPGRQNSIEFRRQVPKVEELRLDFEMPLGRVSGRVLDSHGEPVEQARVTLTMQGGLVFGTVFGGHYTETASDANGEYEIPFLRPGSYTVAAGGAFLGGLFGGGAEVGREVKSIEVGEDEWIRGLDFRLEEPGAITGNVRDTAGKLMPDASIFLRDEEQRLVELFSLAQTNASGSFEYPGLAPGDYTVSARTSSMASSASAAVRVRAGESSEVTVVLEPGTLLLVTLVDKGGADIPSRVSVLDEREREMNGMLGLSQIMERYSGGLDSTVQRIGPLPPGTYRVRAVSEDGRDTSRTVKLSGQAERKVKLRLK